MIGLSRTYRTLELAVRERLATGELPRRPEPEAMCDDRGVTAFHREGSADGSLLPVYHFNALALSGMLPPGGRLLDLGSGSGQFLAYLARRRPDVSIVGLELSAAMAEAGRQELTANGLGGRVRIEVGDMTDLAPHVLERDFDAVSCIYALHHLPGAYAVRSCLGHIATLRNRTGCGVWIFDHARPRSERTARRFPEIFSPGAGPHFRSDSRNSLLASFSFAELSAWTEELLGPGGHELARFLPLLQAHWLPSDGNQAFAAPGSAHWVDEPLPTAAGATFRQLVAIMPGVVLGAAAGRSMRTVPT